MSGPKKSSPRWGLATVGAAAAVLMLGLATAVVSASVAGAQAPTTVVSPLGGGQSSSVGSSLTYTGQGIPVDQQCDAQNDAYLLFVFTGGSATNVQLHGIDVTDTMVTGGSVHFTTPYVDPSSLINQVYVTWDGDAGQNPQLVISHGCAGTEESSSSSSSSTTEETTPTSLPPATSGGDAARQCEGSVSGHAWVKGLSSDGVLYEGKLYLSNRQGDTLASGQSDENGNASFAFTTSVPVQATALVGLKFYSPDGSVVVLLADIPIAPATGCGTTTAGSSTTSTPATTKATVPSTTTKVTHHTSTNKSSTAPTTMPSPTSASISLIPPTSATAVVPPTCTKDQVLKNGKCVTRPTVPGPVVKTSQSQGFPVPHTNGTGTIGTSSGTYWTIGSGMGLVLAAAGAMALRRRRQRRA